MNALLKACVLALCFAFFNTPALAGDRATADEAVAMVKKAVAYIKANGKEKAFEEFNNTKGQFVDRNLYIFVYDMNGNNLAIGNGNAKKMVGKNLIDMRDADGTYLIKKLIEVSSTKGKGWVDYKWPNPVNNTVEAKSSYVEKVDDYFVGAGIYKQ
ncbi:MAG TPA: cache domain-containing protein [Noviherbaspirillum sp.]|uniref:cache domain-containing protein n=1 Tax=Noviherbaspirillum sp. TaxID=1926288 RepID=UPI002D3DDC6A|nr:cache domain-containing protein [Noviherbaspirillum sp.]HYD97316.1 cache domain-containing protein [Noviherbaspirillum sp.]